VIYCEPVFLLLNNNANNYRAKYLRWEEDFDQRFPGCVGAIWNRYLSPSMMFSIAQEFVSQAIIQRKLNQIRGKELVDIMKSEQKES